MRLFSLGCILLCLGFGCLMQQSRAQMTLTGVGPSGGAPAASVLFDTSAFSNPGSTGVTTQTFTNFLNVGSGSNGTTNRILLVSLHFINGNSGVSSAPSVSWNGTDMGAFLGHIGNGAAGDVYIFGMVAPATGLHSFVASWTGANQVMLSALSLVDADQTGGGTTFQNVTTNTGNSTTASVTVSSATGQIVFGAHVGVGNFATASGTDIGHNNTGNQSSGASNWDVGAASTTVSYTVTSGVWASIGVSVKAN